MKRNANRKGTKGYDRAHPAWTPERTARFKATMAAKKASNGVNASNGALIAEFATESAIDVQFVEHFVGIFAPLDKNVKREIIRKMVDAL